MGQIFITRSFEKCSEQKLIMQVNDACQQAAHESGRSYSGDWGEKIGEGLVFTQKTFNLSVDASTWLSEHCDKYGPLLAVKVLDAPVVNTESFDKKIKVAKEKLNTMLIEVGDRSATVGSSTQPMTETILARVKNAKAKFKGCDCCGSKISIQHLHRPVCPVCGNKDFLLTDTDKKKFERLREKMVVVGKEIKTLEDKRTEKYQAAIDNQNKDNWFWFVGGACAS